MAPLTTLLISVAEPAVRTHDGRAAARHSWSRLDLRRRNNTRHRQDPTGKASDSVLLTVGGVAELCTEVIWFTACACRFFLKLVFAVRGGDSSLHLLNEK